MNDRVPVCPMCGRVLFVETNSGKAVCTACTPPRPGDNLVSMALLNRGDHDG